MVVTTKITVHDLMPAYAGEEIPTLILDSQPKEMEYDGRMVSLGTWTCRTFVDGLIADGFFPNRSKVDAYLAFLPHGLVGFIGQNGELMV